MEKASKKSLDHTKVPLRAWRMASVGRPIHKLDPKELGPWDTAQIIRSKVKRLNANY